MIRDSPSTTEEAGRLSLPEDIQTTMQKHIIHHRDHIPVIKGAMQKHARRAEFHVEACGAISNMTLYKPNSW